MKRPVFWVSIAFVIGVVSELTVGVMFSVKHLLVIGIIPILIPVFLMFRFFLKQRGIVPVYGMILFAFYVFGVSCTHSYQNRASQVTEWMLLQDSMTGIVSGIENNGFLLKADTPNGNRFYCRVWSKNDWEVSQGTKVCVSGPVSAFRKPENPGEFDSNAYYQSIGVLTECNADQINILEPPGVIAGFGNRVRSELLSSIQTIFSVKTGGIVSAVMLGRKEGLDSDCKEVMRRLGGSHVLSVSGMHFSILLAIIMLLLGRFFRKKYASLLGVPFLLFWGILVGFPVSCVRALGLCIFASVARFLGRRMDGLTVLAVLFMVFIGLRPVQLLNSGTQFSFLAVMFFMLVLPQWNKKKQEETNKVGQIRRKVSRLLKNTLLIQLCMLPFTLYYFWSFSPYSIVFNLILVTVLPFVFFWSLLILFVSVFSASFAGVLATPIEIFFSVLFSMGQKLLRLPFSTIVTGRPEVWGIVLYLLILSVLTYRCYKKNFHIVRLLILILSIVLLFRQKEKNPVLTFLSVGQGACCVIQADNKICVVDCGSSSRESVGTETLLNFLHFNGYRSIDLLVVSHLDDDHRNGIDEMVKSRVPISRILVLDYQDDCGKVWLENIRYEGRYDAVRAGDKYGVTTWYRKKYHHISYVKSGLSLLVVWPGEIPETSNNNSSMGLLAEVGTAKILFCGDTDADGLFQMSAEIGEIDVLVVPHHGSRNSASAKAYQMLRPKYAVISCEKNNAYGHPHAETLNRLEEVGAGIYRTDCYGAIILTFSTSGEVEIEGYGHSVGLGSE